eukprot:TRINITY_DN204_c0_g1_i1.p10 TRINITY_DN204_c0_g1~~TRINITY_DN204_c0_g1_i1.p10  ORF type:complete len:100 (+),score=12.64 TRINITY_DN204_c0_g1_i1:2408-2707(+)
MEDIKEDKPAVKFTLKPKVENEKQCKEYYKNTLIRQKEREGLLNLSRLSTLMQLGISQKVTIEAVRFKQYSKVNGVNFDQHHFKYQYCQYLVGRDIWNI